MTMTLAEVRAYNAGLEAAAAYHDAEAANAAVRFGALDRWSDCSDERIGWRSWKDANDRHRYYAAVLRDLIKPEPVAPTQELPTFYDNEPLESQVAKLGNFIMKVAPHAVCGGAIETAVSLIAAALDHVEATNAG